jgi:hypothetical protein
MSGEVDWVDQVLQVIGAVLILVANGLSQLRLLNTSSYVYLVLNVIGSGILGVLALASSQWGFLLLEGVWALISILGIANRMRGGEPPQVP